MARLAWTLQDIAARMAGEDGSLRRADPVRWAYVLRDAVALAGPDVVVAHADDALEADALLASSSGEDFVDRLLGAPPLAQTAPVAGAVELVSTLAGIHRGGPVVAAVVTGPVTVAARLAPELLGDDPDEDDRSELADLVADALAGLVGAYAEAGAGLVVVREPDSDLLADASEQERAHGPVARALGHHRADALLSPPPDRPLAGAGYPAVAQDWDGEGDAPEHPRLPADLWAQEPAAFAERWAALAPGLQAAGGIATTDAPIPAAAPLENVRAR